jgi:hypothetical protein
MLDRPMLLSFNSVYPLVNLSTVASQHQLSSHPPSGVHLLVPHISQNTSAFGNPLLLPASSTRSIVLVGGAALHLCDLAEAGGVGLLVDVRRWSNEKEVRLGC